MADAKAITTYFLQRIEMATTMSEPSKKSKTWWTLEISLPKAELAARKRAIGLNPEDKTLAGIGKRAGKKWMIFTKHAQWKY